MSLVDFDGEDSPELKRAMDTAMTIVTSTMDVKGVMLVVFMDELDAPSGTSVSLQARGILPDTEWLLRILKTLLTEESPRRESS